jgi:hypothetical protein
MTDRRAHAAEAPAEFIILRSLWNWSMPILLVTALVAGAVWYTTRTAVPTLTVQSELLVRVGYEYSPVPWSSATETQQINFRADEVIGTEIQLLTAEKTIQKALAAAPHSEMVPATDGGFDAAQVLLVRKKLAVKRLEGSNVILIEMTDPDEGWAVAFSQALLDAYLQDRKQLFADSAYDELLAEEEISATKTLAGLDSEVLQIGLRIADTTDYLSNTSAALAASPAQPELRASLARDIQALQIFVGGFDRMAVLEDRLGRIAGVLAAESAPETTAVTGNRVSDELLKSAVSQLTDDAARLNAITGERENLVKRLDTIRTAQLRKSMRDEASHNMTVMTPPRVLATTTGYDRVQRTVLAGLMALILSSLFFLYVDGLRRRSA